MYGIFWERCLKSMKYIQNRTNWCWVEGKFPGNDQMKMRGLKYVVLGDCESNLIQTITLGTYESVHLPETKDHAVTE